MPQYSQQPNEIIRMLASVLNHHGVDNKFNTSDYILAQYLFRALEIYEEGLKARNLVSVDHPGAQEMRDNIGKYIAEKSLENFISTTRACDSWHKQNNEQAST